MREKILAVAGASVYLLTPLLLMADYHQWYIVLIMVMDSLVWPLFFVFALIILWKKDKSRVIIYLALTLIVLLLSVLEFLFNLDLHFLKGVINIISALFLIRILLILWNYKKVYK